MLSRKGIVLAGGAGTRLHPITLATSKQLLPIYDKPMVFYPLSVLMLAGIREILIISTPTDLPAFRRLLGDGSRFGVKFSYTEQPSPDGLAQAFLLGEEFLNGHPAVLILGDNLFYGADLTAKLREAHARTTGATIFGYEVSNPSAYGVIEFDQSGKPLAIIEKPPSPTSRWAVPGLYFYDSNVCHYAKTLRPSPRGELEITDLNRIYLEKGTLHVIRLGRGIAWLDTGTHDSLLEAADFVRAIQNRQGLRIACLEEIAYNQGWISLDQLRQLAQFYGKSTYGQYLLQLINHSNPPTHPSTPNESRKT
ncbi:MAG: glucose-1-phosphate thymidylyltransferase RfbA [Chthoniobacterales bacterium]|nr:glucose-1-phosphate thymidylyltransferase RfbA [Chthoniobacterales bacterium]